MMAQQAMGRALVRKLWPHERGAYLAHLQRLDFHSRVCRFGGAVSDDFLAQHAAKHFNVDAVIYGAVDGGHVRAAGELHGNWLDPRQPAEAALSVEPDWRRHGLGAEILELLLNAARNRGRRQVMFVCLPGNRPMRRLLETQCSDDLSQLDSETGRVTLSLRTPRTMLTELTQDAVALASGFGRRG